MKSEKVIDLKSQTLEELKEKLMNKIVSDRLYKDE